MELASIEYVESAGESYPVTEENISGLLSQVEPMHQLLMEIDGVGLTAVQVGMPYKMSIYSLEPGHLMLFFNGRYMPLSNKRQWSEGCLTYPELKSKKVRRSKEIRAFMDVWDGEKLVSVTYKMRGLEARVFQHEVDHQLGKTIYMK